MATFSGEIDKIVRDDSFRAKIAPLGSVTYRPYSRGNALAEFQQAELAKWGKAVHDSGAKVDQ